MGYLRRFIMAENNEIVLQKSSAPIPQYDEAPARIGIRHFRPSKERVYNHAECDFISGIYQHQGSNMF
jgi:hypothetical protein